MRCAAWNADEGSQRYFMSAEDLTTQAGLSVQQDLALVNLLGITHVERNGHHYVNGMAALPQAEQDAFFAAHPDVYERSHGAVRLAIRDGRIAIGSLDAAGFASSAMPDFAAMQRADTFVLVLPCGKSAHLELGWAVGAGKRTAVLHEDPCEPELMYRMVDHLAPSMVSLLRWLDESAGGT